MLSKLGFPHDGHRPARNGFVVVCNAEVVDVETSVKVADAAASYGRVLLVGNRIFVNFDIIAASARLGAAANPVECPERSSVELRIGPARQLLVDYVVEGVFAVVVDLAKG